MKILRADGAQMAEATPEGAAHKIILLRRHLPAASAAYDDPARRWRTCWQGR